MASGRCADGLVAALWVLHLAVVYPSLILTAPPDNQEATDEWNRFGTSAFISALVALGWSYVLWQMTSNTLLVSKVFRVSQLAAFVLFLLQAVQLAYFEYWVLAVGIAVVAVGDLFWMRRARERIAFVVEVLKLVQSLLRPRLRELVSIIIIVTTLQVAFSVLWVAAVIRVMQFTSAAASLVVMLLMMLSYRWTTGMLRHSVTHVVAVQVTHALRAAAVRSGQATHLASRLRSLTETDDGTGTSPAAGTSGSSSSSNVASRGAAEAPAPTAAGAELDAALQRVDEVAEAGGVAVGISGPDGGRHSAAADAQLAAPPVGSAAAAASAAALDAGPGRASTDADDDTAPQPAATLLRAWTALVGPLATGALLGWASPVAWAFRRGAWAAARRLMGNAQAAAALAAASTGDAGDAATSSSSANAFNGSGGDFSAVTVGGHGGHSGAGLRARGGMRGACGRLALRAHGLFDGYLRRSHKYAHVLCATQGRGWADAARLAWAQLERSGLDGVIDDDVTDRLLLFGGYVGGSVLALLLGSTVHAAAPGSWVWALAVIFAVGFSAVALPLVVVEASVSTLFVTFAQLPEVLAAVHPVLYHRFARLAEAHAHLRGREAVRAVGRGGPGGASGGGDDDLDGI